MQTRRGALLLDLSLGAGCHHGAGEQEPDATARRLSIVQQRAGFARHRRLRLSVVSQEAAHTTHCEAVLETGLVVGERSRFYVAIRKVCGT